VAHLVLGPVLRHVGPTDATVWVETDTSCEVEVLGHRARTFHVEGHHFAIVTVEGLAQGSVHEYGVSLDGRQAWPEPGSDRPASLVRTIDPERETKIVFGSCRVSAPHEPPYTLPSDEDEQGRGVDALRTYALRMLQAGPETWPHLLLLVGDQVYADEVSPEALEFIRSRRDTSEPPGEEVADFEEYTRLYRESWQEPIVRWLLSTVASAMLFDDHDVHDDWNVSRSWVERMRAKPWWGERIVGAFMSYWLYQHLGNLSPTELASDELLAQVREAEDGGPRLREFAARADREARGTRWSFSRDLGRTRLLGIDCRAGRVLEEGRRSMVDDQEWQWIVERTAGDFDHLLLAMSDPFLLSPGAHHFQAWNEAVNDGTWGKAFAGLAERLREAADLDHWASFRDSFARMTELLRAVGAGERGVPPASIVALSGDVHHAYLAEVAFPRASGVESHVYQVVCSALRNPLDRRERRLIRLAGSRVGELIGRALASAARVEAPSIRWRLRRGPSFENQVGTLELDGRRGVVRVETALRAGNQTLLEQVFEHRLA
jgi:PhoD-like phosphatase